MAAQFPIKIRVAQFNPIVGAIEYNTRKALEAIVQAKREGTELLVFPELFLMGYPPYDLLFEKDCLLRLEKGLLEISKEATGIDVVIGTPFGSPDREGRVFNTAVHILNGKIVGTYCKQCLPFYDVFFEPRYFRAGSERYVFDIKGVKIQIVICEDVWSASESWGELYDKKPLDPPQQVDLLLVLSASPWYVGKEVLRGEAISNAAQKLQVPVLAVNQVGGQDDLLFDGRSFVVNAKGQCVWKAPAWKEGLFFVGETSPLTQEIGLIEPITFGIAEYVRKTEAHDVVIGVSGGIDSAVVALLAAQALGKERVHLFFLPSRFTSKESEIDAQSVAHLLGVPLTIISIEPLFQEALRTLSLECEGFPGNIVVENIQARLRCLILMAQANKPGHLLLCSSNKTELSVGYTTIYGDMSGAFAPIGDLFKEEVYQIGRALQLSDRICTKPPSPELSTGQSTEEEMPLSYKELDPILEKLVLRREGEPSLLREYVVSKEFKRRQAPVVLKVSSKAFGSGRLFPIAGSCLPF